MPSLLAEALKKYPRLKFAHRSNVFPSLTISTEVLSCRFMLFPTMLHHLANETGTTVVWPQKLKIGIKKGKNPDITICGPKYEGVMLAKKIILEHFEVTSTNRITLKMDVSYTGHSHIIGKGGETVNSVMSETG